ncbi:MAG: SRPBCC family protein [Acidihalobacter sp.]|uniref:SRPBCC family protein n=1 Tax=Acidihalobacter sp. TaxID=1872108 RepID=UPI00307EFD5A
MQRRCLSILALCLAAPSAQAVDFRVLHVHYGNGLHVELRALVKAPMQRVDRLLNDYDALARLVPIVTESQRIVGAAPGAQRVRTQVRGCVWFMCTSLTNVIDVTRTGPGAYRAVTVPAQSDFSAGDMDWSYKADGRYTLVSFDARLKPALWLPPLLGPYLVERKVRSQLIQGVRHLEAQARSRKPVLFNRPSTQGAR